MVQKKRGAYTRTTHELRAQEESLRRPLLGEMKKQPCSGM